ncbi:hypothetical protein N752_07115 [Desulforamulus aquiferis]|nr:hypothetical protein N752_07115 [Desulforamulus aquiferis]
MTTPYSLVDYNRTGVPLIEIVSEPDLSSPEEARAYVEKLRAIIQYTGVSDCRMEEGSLRCDANVSVRPTGQKEFGTKAEIKNMNSFRALQRAVAYEVERQIGVLESGGKIVQETRTWDEAKGITLSMRSKSRPTIIVISLIQTWCPWCWITNGLTLSVNHCPSCRINVKPDMRKNWDCGL